MTNLISLDTTIKELTAELATAEEQALKTQARLTQQLSKVDRLKRRLERATIARRREQRELEKRNQAQSSWDRKRHLELSDLKVTPTIFGLLLTDKK